MISLAWCINDVSILTYFQVKVELELIDEY